MYFISQVGQHDCAFACLKMLLANYHHDKNYLFLKGEDKPYSFMDLKKIANEYHMDVSGIRASGSKEIEKNKNYPFIVTLEKRKGYKHSVLVLKMSRKYVTIYDPETGKRKILSEIFYNQWDRKALVVNKEPGYQKIKCDIQIDDFIDKKDKITIPIWQIISSISLAVGMYFINSNSYFFVPIIFLSLFIIFEIMFRKNLISAMQRMDDNIFDYQINVEKEQFYDFYKVMEKYRYVSLTIIPNLVYVVLISVFITMVLVMNSTINLIYIFLALLLAIVHVYIYLPYQKSKHDEIADKEIMIKDVQNQFQFRAVVNAAHESAYKLGIFRNSLTYVEVAALLMSIITVMALSHIINITYVVFYLCISVYLKDNFIRLMQYSDQSAEYNNQLAKLLHYMDLSIKNNPVE